MPLRSDDTVFALRQTIEGFYNEIARLIEVEDWDDLNDMLEKRQQYLEQVFVDSVSESLRVELGEIAQAIMAQDAVFQSIIQVKRGNVIQQRMAFERGKKALDAYSRF